MLVKKKFSSLALCVLAFQLIITFTLGAAAAAKDKAPRPPKLPEKASTSRTPATERYTYASEQPVDPETADEVCQRLEFIVMAIYPLPDKSSVNCAQYCAIQFLNYVQEKKSVEMCRVPNALVCFGLYAIQIEAAKQDPDAAAQESGKFYKYPKNGDRREEGAQEAMSLAWSTAIVQGAETCAEIAAITAVATTPFNSKSTKKSLLLTIPKGVVLGCKALTQMIKSSTSYEQLTPNSNKGKKKSKDPGSTCICSGNVVYHRLYQSKKIHPGFESMCSTQKVRERLTMSTALGRWVVVPHMHSVFSKDKISCVPDLLAQCRCKNPSLYHTLFGSGHGGTALACRQFQPSQAEVELALVISGLSNLQVSSRYGELR